LTRLGASLHDALGRHNVLVSERGQRPTTDDDADGSDGALLLSTRAFVRSRRPRNTWVNWNHRLGGGPQVHVRERSVQVVAPQGSLLETRNVKITAEGATAAVDKIGWAGSPLGKRECIHLAGIDERGRRWEFAISPSDGLDATMRALSAAGVNVG
jgi:hypothetical protein